MIEVRELIKSYGDIEALKNISFSIDKGGIHGILGAAGAGKTTLLDVLCGVMSADSGTVIIDGVDIAKEPVTARGKIGYLPQTHPFYEYMSVYEYLSFVGEAKGVAYDKLYRNLNSVLELTDIKERGKSLIKNLSRSERVRLGIAQAMLGNPDVIFIDEPFCMLGADDVSDLKDLLKKLGEIKTVVISSSSLELISELCGDMLIVSDGELIAQGEIAELEMRVGKSFALCISVRGQKDGVISALEGIEGLSDCILTENKDGIVSLKLEYERGYEIRDAVFASMAEAGYPILSMETRAMTLEDVYMKLKSDREKNCERGES